MSAKFIIESVNVDGPHAHVRATVVEGTHIGVSKGSELGGVRLRSALHQQNPQTYLFELETASDSAKLKVGSIVELVR